MLSTDKYPFLRGHALSSRAGAEAIVLQKTLHRLLRSPIYGSQQDVKLPDHRAQHFVILAALATWAPQMIAV